VLLNISNHKYSKFRIFLPNHFGANERFHTLKEGRNRLVAAFFLGLANKRITVVQGFFFFTVTPVSVLVLVEALALERPAFTLAEPLVFVLVED